MNKTLSIFCIFLATACGSDENAATSDNGGDNTSQQPTGLINAVVVDVDGADREYNLYIPSTQPVGAMPLLVAVHGGSGRSEPYPQQNQFQELAETEGFIIAYPLSELLSGNEGEWQLNTDTQSSQDIRFVEAIIDQVSSRFTIDEQKIYATGYSLGAMFTYELACHLSSRFAALVAHAGTMPIAPNSCEQESNVAIMHLHGAEDSIISYNNSWDWKAWDSVGTMMDIPSLIAFWSNQYNCQNESARDTSSSVNTVYYDCDEDVRVEHHRITGAGHEWPDSIGGVPTTEVVWTFLTSFSKT
jgi:polyhydroxybutyrate depolymerase